MANSKHPTKIYVTFYGFFINKIWIALDIAALNFIYKKYAVAVVQIEAMR